MVDWTWLTPWLEALEATISVKLATVSTRNGDEDSFSMVPCVEHLTVRLPNELAASPTRCESLKMLREALVIVAHALRADPSVWSLLKLAEPPSTSAKLPAQIHHRSFREEDLCPAYQLRFDGGNAADLSTWLGCVCELVGVSNGEDESPVWLADIHAKLSEHGLLGGEVTVPLSLRVRVDGDQSFGALAKALEDICGGQTVAAGSTRAQTSVFHLSEVELLAREATEAMASSINRIQALGISLAVVNVASATYTDAFHACVSSLRQPAYPESVPVRRLSLIIPGNDLSLGLYSELLQPGPLSPATLAVTISSFLDHLLLAQLVRDAWPRRTSAVRALELTAPFLAGRDLREWQDAAPLTAHLVCINPETRAGAKLVSRLTPREREAVVDRELAIPMVYVRGYDYIVLPGGRLLDLSTRKAVLGVVASDVEARQQPRTALDSPISLRCTFLSASDGVTPVLLPFVASCLPTLRSLDLYIATGATFTNDDLRAIVKAYPLLESLTLAHTSITSLDAILEEPSRNGSCSRLRVLSLDAGDLGFLPFLAALADPKSAICHTLTEFKFNYVDDAEDEYLSAIETVLQHNRVLQYLQLVLKRLAQPAIEKVISALRPWHRRPLVDRRVKSWAREKASFLSVWGPPTTILPASKRLATARRSPHNARLDESALALVLSFAAPFVRRLIHVNHETRREVYYGYGQPLGACRNEQIDDQLLAL